MVLLRLKKSAAPFRRRPGRTGGTRCEGMTIQGRIVLPDPWPKGIRRGFPAGAIFCREPGLQRGRRRAPFARSREKNAYREMTSWRTERFHRAFICLSSALRPASLLWDEATNGGCAALTRPTVKAAFVYWRVRCAYPPYGKSGFRLLAGALRLPALRDWASRLM